MAKAKVNISWPHQSIDKPVAYDWEAGHGGWAGDFWERRRKKVISKLQAARQIFDDDVPELTDLGRHVLSMGEKERAKELHFLQKNLPDFKFDDISDKDLITKINEVVNGEKQFSYALDRIKNAIKMGRKKAKSTGEDYKGLAPTMASVFFSYVGTEVTDRMRNLAKTLTPTDAVKEWKANLDKIVEESIDAAMEKALEKSIATKEQDAIYGDQEQWKEVGEAYKKLEGFQRQFKDMLKSQLNLEELRNFFDTEKGKTVLKKTRRNKVKTGNFREAIGWSSQELSNTIGGNVQEYLITLIENMMPKGATITDKQATVFLNKVQKIDTGAAYQYETEINIDFTKMIDKLNEFLIDSTSLIETARKFQEFYDKNLAGLSKENFFTVSNVKSYSLGAGFSGFHNGGEQPLERLTDYVSMLDISKDKIEDFIWVAYNTLSESGFYKDEREDISDQIRNMLTAAAARLLFDDWSTIGVENTGTQMIHFFNLDGIIIPSSVFFLNLGQAMIDTAESVGNENKMRTWFSVYVKLPTTVKYHEGDWKTFGETNEEIKNKIYKKWEEQAAIAKKESSFSSKFLLNFKGLMIKQLGGESVFK